MGESLNIEWEIYWVWFLNCLIWIKWIRNGKECYLIECHAFGLNGYELECLIKKV